jgi:protein-disulfide isomerase
MRTSRLLPAVVWLCACTAGPDGKAPAPGPQGAATTPTTTGQTASNGSVPSSGQAGKKTDEAVRKADVGRIRGDSTAKVWMIVMSDFQCPFCKQFHDSSDKALRAEYVDNGKVRLAFVNYPLPQHKNAPAAAEVAMCASAQDKFWQMHDALFESQDKWVPMQNPMPFFEQLAQGAGVDMAALRSCVASHKMVPLIDVDRDAARRAGAESTPTFLINGQRVAGAIPLPALRRTLDYALHGPPASK